MTRVLNLRQKRPLPYPGGDYSRWLEVPFSVLPINAYLCLEHPKYVNLDLVKVAPTVAQIDNGMEYAPKQRIAGERLVWTCDAMHDYRASKGLPLLVAK